MACKRWLMHLQVIIIPFSLLFSENKYHKVKINTQFRREILIFHDTAGFLPANSGNLELKRAYLQVERLNYSSWKGNET